MSSSNYVIHFFENDVQILKSYHTPVAAFFPSIGYVKTARKYSVTTSRHVNHFSREAKEISHEEFLSLIKNLA